MSNDDAVLPGMFCWHELATTKPEEAVAFYSKLFGWDTSVMDMGEGGEYTVFEQDGESIAGVMPIASEDGEEGMSHWLNYVSVDDMDARIETAQSLGAQIALPLTEVPGVGHFCVLVDPTGAVFALFQGAPDVDDEE